MISMLGHTLCSKTSIDWQWKDREKIDHVNRNEERAWVTVSTLDRMDFKTKILTKDKEGHFLIMKHQSFMKI